MAADFRTILCAVDFDELAGAAISWAAEMAARNGAQLYVLHVAPLEPNSWDRGSTSRLEALARDRIEKKVDHRFIVRDGAAAIQILETARELGADLIVIPTHGRKGLKRFLLGSVAEHVVRESRVPVLMIPASDDAGK